MVVKVKTSQESIAPTVAKRAIRRQGEAQMVAEKVLIPPEVTAAVDEVGAIEAQIEELTKRKTQMQKLVNSFVLENNITEIQGKTYLAEKVVKSGRASTSIDPRKFYAACERNQLLDKFWGCISVISGSASKAISKIELDTITTRTEGTKSEAVVYRKR